MALIIAADARHYVLQALDNLIRGIEAVSTCLIKSIETYHDPKAPNFEAQAAKASAEITRAAKKLARYHPNAEELRVAQWDRLPLPLFEAYAKWTRDQAQKTKKKRNAMATATIEEINRATAAIVAELRQVKKLRGFLSAPSDDDPNNDIVIVAGGYRYGTKVRSLNGRPLAMLKALLDSDHHRLTRDQLRDKMKIDDAYVEYPWQVIKDAASALRASLRKAMGRAAKNHNPLPSEGRGDDLTYVLDLNKKI